MDLPSLVAGIVRGLGLASLAGVIGGLVLDALILPAGVPELSAARARLRRLTTACIVLALLAAGADLVARTQAMSRAPLAVAVVAIPDVVTRTHVGAILIARAGMLVLALIVSLTRAAALRVLCLLIALAGASTLTLTGHADDWGDWTVSVAVGWAHAVAALAWTGGLVALALVVFRPKSEGSPALVAVLAPRFSRFAGLCLLAVILTGIYNAWAQLGAFPRLWSTAYGGVLIVKVLIVAALAWLGAINRYAVIPRLVRPRAVRPFGERFFRVARLVVRGPRRRWTSIAAPSQLTRYVAGEAVLAGAVFVCTAALAEVTPGRHVSFERRPTTHVTNIQPRTSLARTRPGTVTPPAGDVARGRAVFVKLRCFTCHAVETERFLAATQPGPDLTGASSHPPGYLVESILNPQAMILDGPGYTDDRGLSTMPEYRQTMTIGELIDLVAFLRSLGGPPRPPTPG